MSRYVPHTRSMRDRITIEQSTVTKDSHHQAVVTYVPQWTNVPASFDFVSGGETRRGRRQVEAGVVGVFRIRKLDGVTVQHQITHEGVCYGIVHVELVEGHYEGGHQYMDIHVRAAVE